MNYPPSLLTLLVVLAGCSASDQTLRSDSTADNRKMIVGNWVSLDRTTDATFTSDGVVRFKNDQIDNTGFYTFTALDEIELASDNKPATGFRISFYGDTLMLSGIGSKEKMTFTRVPDGF